MNHVECGSHCSFHLQDSSSLELVLVLKSMSFGLVTPEVMPLQMPPGAPM